MNTQPPHSLIAAAFSCALAFITGCATPGDKTTGATTDTIYTGGSIITIHDAYWYREETVKGSLEVGKLVDLVLLDQNPLAVPPMTIKDIKVVESIKEGRTLYRAH